MTTHDSRKPARLDRHLARQQAAGRRTALIVAALLVIALLAPFVAFHFAG